MAWQIQSWPTPEIFIVRAGRRLADRAGATFGLLSVEAIQPLVEDLTGSPDRAAGSFGLLSVSLIISPFTESVSEVPANAAYGLASVVVWGVPLSRSASEAPANAAFGLKSVFVIQPLIRTLSPENCAARVGLLSVNVI
jgi:hypothetical protein